MAAKSKQIFQCRYAQGDGCAKTFTTPQGRSAHERVVHEGVFFGGTVSFPAVNYNQADNEISISPEDAVGTREELQEKFEMNRPNFPERLMVGSTNEDAYYIEAASVCEDMLRDLRDGQVFAIYRLETVQRVKHVHTVEYEVIQTVGVEQESCPNLVGYDPSPAVGEVWDEQTEERFPDPTEDDIRDDL